MMFSLLLITLAASDGGGPCGPPRALACLTRWYSLEVVRGPQGWSMRLPDGALYPFDDGREKTLEEKLESTDMEDTFSLPYRTGPIIPVIAANDSGGRIRFDPVFRATYGKSKARVDIVRFTFFGQRVMVHRKVLGAFEKVASRLGEAVGQDPSLTPFLKGVGGTFNWRKISDTQRQSAHSYGVSIDLNVARSHYWEWQRPKQPLVWKNRFPQAIVDAFEAEGFIWGGRWDHYDTMHFEFRPELLDPSCREPPSFCAPNESKPSDAGPGGRGPQCRKADSQSAGAKAGRDS
ncbi:MAG: M15 family metallopeptidase [Myxococcaceae bacterium]